MLTKELQHKIDFKTKPLGALGTLESIALQIGNIQNTLTPKLAKPTIVVFAADHGIALKGVSAYPQAVTHQMVLNFLGGGAAINVFSKQHGIELKIVDAGVNFDFGNQIKLVSQKIALGTQSFDEGDAMSKTQCNNAIKLGKELVAQIASQGTNIIGFGEMGIGNTSSAAMIMHYTTGLPLQKCVGAGTGLNSEQLLHKLKLLKKTAKHHGALTQPKEVLQKVGGFEIAQMVGAMLEAYEQKMVILVDGFIASAAYLIAQAIKPKIKNNAIFCHTSHEKGHQLLLDYCNAKPLLQLNMRLGEGTGCAVSYPIIESAVRFLNEMASFESAGVSNKS